MKSLLPCLLLATSSAVAAPFTVPHTFSNGTVADADAVNEDFAALAGAHNAVMTPALHAPADGAAATSLTRLSWGGGGGRYTVEVDASGTFGNPFTATTDAPSVLLREVLRSGATVSPGTWYWRVKAAAGAHEWTSATRSFTYTVDGTTCAAILSAAGSAPDGFYWIKPGSAAAYRAWCDMSTNGGGWTLVWTKVNPGFVAWKATFDSACASATASDCASAVNPAQGWTRALWRFGDDASCWVQFDNRRHTDFKAYLNGANLANNPTVTLSRSLHGATTYETGVGSMHYYATQGISEAHSGSDTWIDLWNGVDSTNGYFVNESPSTLSGTKCLCGMCRAAPVWMLVK